MCLIKFENTIKLIKLSFLISLVLISCGENPIEAKEQDSLSKSKTNIEGLINDAKNNTDFKNVFKKYYYKPEEILNNNAVFYEPFESLYIYLKEKLKKNSDSLFLYWNKDVINADKYYDYTWLNEDGFCKEALLMMFSQKSKQTDRICFCFNEEGLIYSTLPLMDPESGATVWIRDQTEFVTINGEPIEESE